MGPDLLRSQITDLQAYANRVCFVGERVAGDQLRTRAQMTPGANLVVFIGGICVCYCFLPCHGEFAHTAK